MTLISAVCVVLLSVAVIASFIGIVFIRYPRQHNKKITRLKDTGQRGEATILSFQGPGPHGYGNTNPMYRRIHTQLEIRVSGITPYKIDKVFTIPSQVIERLEVGKVVPVWIDPAQPMNQDKIVIDIV